MAAAVGLQYDIVDQMDNLQSVYHPIGAAILTVSALFDQILWQIFRILRLKGDRLDYFSSWKDIVSAIKRGFLDNANLNSHAYDYVYIELKLRGAFGVEDGQNDNRMLRWKILLRDLRDRFLHRSMYLLQKDLTSMNNILRNESLFKAMHETFRGQEKCFGSSPRSIYTKEQSYECMFQLYRLMLFKKLRQLFEVFTDFREMYPPPAVTNADNVNNCYIFDQSMTLYSNEINIVDDKSVIAYIEYQMDLEEGIASGFLNFYIEKISATYCSEHTEYHSIAPYSLTYTGYRFIEMTVLLLLLPLIKLCGV